MAGLVEAVVTRPPRGEFVSIDPGLDVGCGMAAWDERGKLVRARFMPAPVDVDFPLVTRWERMAQMCWAAAPADCALAIEFPQINRRETRKPESILVLAGLAASIAAWFNATTLYRPREWKGSITKDVTEHRARKRLSEAEIARVELPRAARQRGDVWDAIGIGLHHLGR